MIEKQLYECEYCYTRYETQEEALACEASHKTVVRISGANYVSQKTDKRGLPYRLFVVFDDGSTAMYDRVMEK